MGRVIAVDEHAVIEWPKAVVDAPDAYYEAVKVKVTGTDVVVSDQRGDAVGVYRLDAPVPSVRGVLAGMVGGEPFTVSRGCNCGTPFSKTLKGAG